MFVEQPGYTGSVEYNIDKAALEIWFVINRATLSRFQLRRLGEICGITSCNLQGIHTFYSYIGGGGGYVALKDYTVLDCSELQDTILHLTVPDCSALARNLS